MNDQSHLYLPKKCLMLIGVWPVEWTGPKLTLYQLYFNFQFFYFIVSDVICQGSMIFASGNQFLETAGNLNVTMVYVINIYRVIICRSRLMLSILERVAKREREIQQFGDAETKKIYKEHVKAAFDISLFYVALGTSGTMLYILSPIVKRFILNLSNENGDNNYLIYPSWFPFDVGKHYFFAYVIEINGALLGYAYIVYIGAFFLCILKYCHCQIKILQNFFANLTHYSEKLAKREGIELKAAAEMFMKFCIKEHQEIIRFTSDVDNSIRTYVLLEFVISSFQLALVVYQLLESSVGVETFRVLLYLATLCCQLYLFYWNCQEIIIQSTDIALSIHESEWFEVDEKLQKTMLLVIMRSQKPMSISIGSFNKVRIDSLIAIFKAIYSYVAFMKTR